MRWHSFSLPKRGHSADEYEDAFTGDPKVGRFAVADGASESSFAGLWARLLVEGFVRPLQQEGPEPYWLGPLQKRWAAEVDGRPLPWYAEEKRSLGAYATFLGLTFDSPEKSKEGTWKAWAVGDSCLFQVRKDDLIKAFPLTAAQDFGNQPQLIGSRTTDRKKLQQRQKQDRGSWQPGDRFFLMTDALAQWFLLCRESGRKPWESIEERLTAAKKDEALTEWIEKLRERDGLRNDDVTLIAIDL